MTRHTEPAYRGRLTPVGRALTRALLAAGSVWLGVAGPTAAAAAPARTVGLEPTLRAHPWRGVATDSLRAAIRALTTSRDPGTPLLARGLTAEWYAQREYAPTWSSGEQRMAAARALASAAHDADEFGLSAARYRPAAIAAAVYSIAGQPAAARSHAALDVLATDLFITLATDLAQGRVRPAALHSSWSAPPRAFDHRAALAELTAGRAVAGTLRHVQPKDESYARLLAALDRYRRIAARGNWPAVPGEGPLAFGAAGHEVDALRTRLVHEGFAAGAAGAPFDSALDEAVRRFQAARGLEPDGVVGRRTLAALREPPADLVARIALNLERLRWEERAVQGPTIDVSIPAFELRVLDAAGARLQMRVIAGRPDWPTPVFDARITHVIFSPFWHVPPNIAVREILPAVRRDPAYLRKHDLTVLSSTGRIVDPSTVAWSQLRAAAFPYRFRQDPGPGNPLGGVKFLLPNPFDVFLHDTPGRAAFSRSDRALSHGCVRLEDAAALAAHLLRSSTGWDRAAITTAMHAGRERPVALVQPIPVRIRYATAWVDDAGVAHFRTDIYGHDARLQRALDAAASATTVSSPDGVHNDERRCP